MMNVECEACNGVGFLLMDPQSRGTCVIQRCDACEHYKSDNDAVAQAYVIARDAALQAIRDADELAATKGGAR